MSDSDFKNARQVRVAFLPCLVLLLVCALQSLERAEQFLPNPVI
nr:hypothetical protein [Klebsiella pneumoniae]